MYELQVVTDQMLFLGIEVHGREISVRYFIEMENGGAEVLFNAIRPHFLPHYIILL